MELKTRKRLAAEILKCSAKRIVFDTDSLDNIGQAITKRDLRNLISRGIITKRPARGISKSRIRKRADQRGKGRQRGEGSRKGKSTARLPKKKAWIDKVRSQRALLNILKEKNVIPNKVFRQLYLKVKGGFFRSRRHIKIYLSEQGLIQNEKKQ